MIEIRLLKSGYKKNEEFYNDFISGELNSKDEYFSDETVKLEKHPSFPIYMANQKEAREDFLEAFKVIEESYIDIDRDIFMDELFWHSYLCTFKRDYLLEKYPSIEENQSNFENIVTKKFDWENYIYKCLLAVQYITDSVKEDDEKLKYYNLILDNLDLYNYIIKYEIFRNDKFLINILDIIEETGLSGVLKSKIKDRSDLGKDERYGRRVIFEFNKSYPIVMAPMLSKGELKEKFIEYLGYYYNMESIALEESAVSI
ncbi:MAG: DUF6339 family protein [Clostridium sp.]